MTQTDQNTEMTLAERVAAHRDKLSATERRVARWLAEHPQDVAFGSAGSLGELTGTSDATVIRTVKSLGYAGLPAVKRSLQGAIRNLLTPAGRLGNSLDAMGTEPRTILLGVLGESARLLDEAQHTVQPAAFTDAVRLVVDAREILVAGLGPLGVLADFLTLRLVRMGRAARCAQASGFLLADDLLRLRAGDVVVLIVHGTVIAETDAVLRRAADVGAEVVLITDTLGPALADRTAVSISAPTNRMGGSAMQSTTFVLLEALAMAVAAQDRAGTLDQMNEMHRLRAGLQPGRPNASRRPAQR